MRGPFPRQREFAFQRAQWRAKLTGIRAAVKAVDALPERINRGIAREQFAQLWPHDAIGAFVTMMAWAYGHRAGYGPHRTMVIITGDSRRGVGIVDAAVEKRLRESARIAVEAGPCEAFAYLRDCHHSARPEEPCGHIRGLGPAFFTKWLNFVTAAEAGVVLRRGGGAGGNTGASEQANIARAATCGVARSALAAGATPTTPLAGARRLPLQDPLVVAPILDSRAVGWLEGYAGRIDRETVKKDEPSLDEIWGFGWSPSTPEADQIRLRADSTSHYRKYIDLLSYWGEPYGLWPAQVADRIYRLICDDGMETNSPEIGPGYGTDLRPDATAGADSAPF